LKFQDKFYDIIVHNKCPSSEKDDEKCILRKSDFHQILPTYYCSKRIFLKITISGTRISSRDGNKQITERVKICLIMCLILRMIISRCSQNFSAVIPVTMIVSDHIYWYIVDCKYEDS